MDLVAFEDLKALLDLDGEGFEEYPALEVLAGSVRTAFEGYLGRTLGAGTYTETVYCYEPAQMISLPALPVTSVASVALADFLPGSTQTPITEYVIAPFGIRVYGAVTGIVSVTYTGGLSRTTGPLKRAALLQTAYEFQNKDHVGAESVSIEGGSISRPALSLLKEVRRTLDPLKHPTLGFGL